METCLPLTVASALPRFACTPNAEHVNNSRTGIAINLVSFISRFSFKGFIIVAVVKSEFYPTQQQPGKLRKIRMRKASNTISTSRLPIVSAFPTLEHTDPQE